MLAWTPRRRLGALRRPGRAAHPADPRGGARRLPPLLRHVPGVADVRGAGHGAARADGQLRGRRIRAARSTGCTWPARATCAARTSASSAPLADLESRDTRVFLGIVLPIDGVAGLRRRHATASRYLDDFGVAMYCGFGRQPGARRRGDDARAQRDRARAHHLKAAHHDAAVDQPPRLVRPPQQERSRRSLQRALDAAVDVLATDGWGGFSVPAVSRRASVSVRCCRGGAGGGECDRGGLRRSWSVRVRAAGSRLCRRARA